MMLAVAADEEIDGHGAADENDEAANPGLREFLRVVGAGDAAEESAYRHDDSLGPDDGARDDEGDGRDAIDDPTEKDFQFVHGMNVRHAQRSEHGEIHDADAAAEIAAVDCNEEFEDRGAHDRRVG